MSQILLVNYQHLQQMTQTIVCSLDGVAWAVTFSGETGGAPRLHHPVALQKHSDPRGGGRMEPQGAATMSHHDDSEAQPVTAQLHQVREQITRVLLERLIVHRPMSRDMS